MRKPVMVQDGSLGFGAGAAVSGGTFTISSAPSTAITVDSKGVYAGPLAWTFAGGNAAGCTPGTVVGAGSINPGASYMKADGLAVMLEDDQATATFQGVAPDGNPVILPGQPVQVASAGQSTVKAD